MRIGKSKVANGTNTLGLEQSKLKKLFEEKDHYHHHHQSGCFSLPKEESLSTCSPQLLVFRNVTPGRPCTLDSGRRTISCFWSAFEALLCPRVTHSVTLIVHLLSRCPCHEFYPSVFAFSYVPDNVCHITQFPNSDCTFSSP